MSVPEKVVQVCEELIISDETLRRVMDALDHEINLGLGKETNSSATVKCFPTYVRCLPNGQEKGKFLALDLGGTNFRVLLIDLEGGSTTAKMVSKIYAVPTAVMVGPGDGLFDHIAQCLSTFMHEHKVENVKIPLGFTFSFPCRQEGLTKGILVTWTKGFNCSGVEGKDVVLMLQEAIRRRGDVEIDVLAVLNDTTGTLMACAYKNQDCRIGLIIGTGTNACYIEKLDKVELWNEDHNEPKQVIINTEWGAFGDNKCLDFIYTGYDREVDETSINPGKQIFEKMISGMYMGDIAGLVLRKLTREGHIFRGNGADEIFKRGAFHTKYISEIEGDKVGDWTNCRQILLEELGIPEPVTDQDCIVVRHVCEVVSRRAAHLVSAGLACLLNKVPFPPLFPQPDDCRDSKAGQSRYEVRSDVVRGREWARSCLGRCCGVENGVRLTS
ncbi:hexokinase type 2 isoform X2 [Folsomia candida]|uniref:hexokinase type 2 isoform X2 n=1 Tax=Folsomia candida TaxID=158441 RepID=UPI000B8F2718|nr:hexokinase type 2 isoform X2 [Folsomia candida]